MKFKINSTLSYNVISPTTFFFNILAANSKNQKVLSENLVLSEGIEYHEYSFLNEDTRFFKIHVAQEQLFTINYEATVAVNTIEFHPDLLMELMLIQDLDTAVLPYLHPSRHCESDKLFYFASNEFGHYTNNYLKVEAINNWIFDSVAYCPGSTNSSTSANDIFFTRIGVCKDFAHLGIALCRALDIPARYFTAYASNLTPPDIHACFEAYLGGEWIVFDPTKLSSQNGLVKIAHAKDASEIAVASYFGNAICTYMDIQCEMLPVTEHAV